MTRARGVVALVLALLVMLGVAVPARGEAFFSAVDLGPLKITSVQDNQTLKTLDTFARQRLAMITGKTSWEGQPALPVILDMTFRPELWRERNVVRIKNVPLRKDFREFAGISDAEKTRILEEGTVSLVFLMRPDVQRFLEEVSSQANFKTSAVNELQNAGAGLMQLTEAGSTVPGMGAEGGFLPMSVVPPRQAGDQNWKPLGQMVPNVPRYLEMLRGMGAMSAKPVEGYEGSEAAIERAIEAQNAMRRGWRDQKVAATNAAATQLSAALYEINPAVYPREAKRKTEYYYNRAAKLTVPAAFVYFAAFTLFLMSVYSGAGALRKWGLGLFIVAFVIHTVAIGIRWWLVSKSVGNWFESIPIKNQFESVLFSSWFGGAVGLGLELWRRGANKWGGIPGAAAAFVGWLSLVAIFSSPFVFGREIGGEIGMVSGVLMSYWLYIHVTTVVASYALIGMSFMLGVWWLIKRWTGSAKGPSLELLDSCNMVILQLAFWVLGVGIILGAVWADQSWGRPWGWDPKETFALVTWIVYLAVVHIRLVTLEKAWWTSVLSIVGFFIMLFNWIGVNFFLVGLHSYA